MRSKNTQRIPAIDRLGSEVGKVRALERGEIMLPRNGRHFYQLPVSSCKWKSTASTDKEIPGQTRLIMDYELPGPNALGGLRFLQKLVTSSKARGSLHLLQVSYSPAAFSVELL